MVSHCRKEKGDEKSGKDKHKKGGWRQPWEERWFKGNLWWNILLFIEKNIIIYHPN